MDSWCQKVEEMTNNRKLITIYESGLGRIDGGDYLDGAILDALFKSTSNQKGLDQGISELKLALSWNRIDLMKDLVFNENSTSKEDELVAAEQFAQLLPFALSQDRIDFVRDFLALFIHEHLTIQLLVVLYNKNVCYLISHTSEEYIFDR